MYHTRHPCSEEAFRHLELRFKIAPFRSLKCFKFTKRLSSLTFSSSEATTLMFESISCIHILRRNTQAPSRPYYDPETFESEDVQTHISCALCIMRTVLPSAVLYKFRDQNLSKCTAIFYSATESDSFMYSLGLLVLV